MSLFPSLSLCLLILLLVGQVFPACWQTNQRNSAPILPNSRNWDKLAGCTGREASFQPLLDPLLHPRLPGTPGHTAARHHIVQKMRDLGWKVELDKFTTPTIVGPRTFSNIVATLHPDSPRRLVLAAHYDSMVTPKGEAIVAAIDSAVPCAMMLHLAVSMTSLLRGGLGSSPEVSLQLVFFDGEEAFVNWTPTDSLYGSRHLADRWAKNPYRVRPGLGHCQDGAATQLDRMDALVLLDLLGTPGTHFHRYPQFNTHLYDLASQLEQRLQGLSCHQGPAMFSNTDSPRIIEDDHIPFHNLGLRNILHLIHTQPRGDFPPVWHKVADNRKALDMASITRVNRFLRAFVFSYLKSMNYDRLKTKSIVFSIKDTQ